MKTSSTKRSKLVGGRPRISEGLKSRGHFDLAAAVCASIRRNHPFVDGNKRAAFVALGLTLGLNGFELDAAEREAADTILALAAGLLSEDGLCRWIAAHSHDVSGSDL